MSKLNLLAIAFFLVLFFYSQSLSQNEDSLTITTYYPAPYGEYTQVEVSRSVTYEPVEQDDVSKEAGKLIFDDDVKKFYYCDGSNWILLG